MALYENQVKLIKLIKKNKKVGKNKEISDRSWSQLKQI